MIVANIYLDKYILRQILVGVAVTIDVILLGAGTSFSSTLLPQLSREDSSLKIANDEKSWIASLSNFGCIPGTIAGSILVEFLGRKWCYICITLLNAASWALIGLSSHSWQLLLGRTLQGVAGGLGCAVCVCYCVEVVSLKYRAVLLNMINIGIAIGQLFVNVMGTYVSWRISAYVLSGISLSYFAIFLYLQNTHVWYLQRQRLNDAKSAFFWYNKKTVANEKNFEEQIKGIDNDAFNLRNVCKEWRTREFYLPLAIMFWFYTTIMCTGGLAISLYSVQIMQSVVDFNEYTITIVIDVLRIVSTIVIIFLLVNSKRRKIVIFGCIGITISLGISITAMFLETYWDGCKIIVLLTILLYTFLFNLCYLNLSYVYVGEIFTGITKPTGVAFVATYLNLLYFITGQITPLIFDHLGNPYAFLVFCICNCVCGVVLYFILRETKDVSSEEIRKRFQKKIQTEQAVS